MKRKEIINFIEIGLKVTLITIIVVGILYFLAYSETHYVRTGFVKKKVVTVNEYYFYDSRGNIWLFETDENLNSDMTIEVKMFNNNTMDYIQDDIIVDYKIISRPELKIEIEK